VQGIGPYEVKQQFNARAEFAESSSFMRLRKALHALLLAKLGPDKAATAFTGACLAHAPSPPRVGCRLLSASTKHTATPTPPS
jgi:hypothetical protein